MLSSCVFLREAFSSMRHITAGHSDVVNSKISVIMTDRLEFSTSE